MFPEGLLRGCSVVAVGKTVGGNPGLIPELGEQLEGSNILSPFL